MHKKLLWKIEELWNQYYKQVSSPAINIFHNYVNGLSKHHNRFECVKEIDFSESEKEVFSDAYGKYKGLKKCQVLEKDSKLIYLFDNHNEMLYSLVEIFEATGKQYDIVHIDAHPDDALFQGIKITSLNLKNIQEYINKTRISDFFDAISETNIVRRIYSLTHSDNLEFFMPPEESYILSLDIDIFGPEGDFAELNEKVRAIASAWIHADVVCIAMSPGFIDQKYAADIIKIFVNQS
jgi:hypothetical protein